MLTHYPWAATELPAVEGGDPHGGPQALAVLAGLEQDQWASREGSLLPVQVSPVVSRCWAE